MNAINNVANAQALGASFVKVENAVPFCNAAVIYGRSLPMQQPNIIRANTSSISV